MCVCAFDSRHDDDAEVEPVPGVPQEGEGSHTETPRQDLYERLERVDTGEGIPERGRRKEMRKEGRWVKRKWSTTKREETVLWVKRTERGRKEEDERVMREQEMMKSWGKQDGRREPRMEGREEKRKEEGISRGEMNKEKKRERRKREAGWIFIKSAKHPSLIYFVPRSKFDPTGRQLNRTKTDRVSQSALEQQQQQPPQLEASGEGSLHPNHENTYFHQEPRQVFQKCAFKITLKHSAETSWDCFHGQLFSTKGHKICRFKEAWFLYLFLGLRKMHEGEKSDNKCAAVLLLTGTATQV